MALSTILEYTLDILTLLLLAAFLWGWCGWVKIPFLYACHLCLPESIEEAREWSADRPATVLTTDVTYTLLSQDNGAAFAPALWLISLLLRPVRLPLRRLVMVCVRLLRGKADLRTAEDEARILRQNAAFRRALEKGRALQASSQAAKGAPPQSDQQVQIETRSSVRSEFAHCANPAPVFRTAFEPNIPARRPVRQHTRIVPLVIPKESESFDPPVHRPTRIVPLVAQPLASFYPPVCQFTGPAPMAAQPLRVFNPPLPPAPQPTVQLPSLKYASEPTEEEKAVLAILPLEILGPDGRIAYFEGETFNGAYIIRHPRGTLLFDLQDLTIYRAVAEGWMKVWQHQQDGGRQSDATKANDWHLTQRDVANSSSQPSRIDDPVQPAPVAPPAGAAVQDAPGQDAIPDQQAGAFQLAAAPVQGAAPLERTRRVHRPQMSRPKSTIATKDQVIEDEDGRPDRSDVKRLGRRPSQHLGSIDDGKFRFSQKEKSMLKHLPAEFKNANGEIANVVGKTNLGHLMVNRPGQALLMNLHECRVYEAVDGEDGGQPQVGKLVWSRDDDQPSLPQLLAPKNAAAEGDASSAAENPLMSMHLYAAQHGVHERMSHIHWARERINPTILEAPLAIVHGDKDYWISGRRTTSFVEEIEGWGDKVAQILEWARKADGKRDPSKLTDELIRRCKINIPGYHDRVRKFLTAGLSFCPEWPGLKKTIKLMYELRDISRM